MIRDNLSNFIFTGSAHVLPFTESPIRVQEKQSAFHPHEHHKQLGSAKQRAE
jgi:hypothetical protein